MTYFRGNSDVVLDRLRSCCTCADVEEIVSICFPFLEHADTGSAFLVRGVFVNVGCQRKNNLQLWLLLITKSNGMNASELYVIILCLGGYYCNAWKTWAHLRLGLFTNTIGPRVSDNSMACPQLARPPAGLPLSTMLLLDSKVAIHQRRNKSFSMDLCI